jgi:hypothetical protein
VFVSLLNRHTRDAAAFLREPLRGMKTQVLRVGSTSVQTKGKESYGYYRADRDLDAPRPTSAGH